jgi:hypothetical protein
MARASVKGTLIGAVIENLIRLRDAGRVADEELELRLEAEEFALLGSKINSAGWYPMASYTRFLELLGDIEGDGSPDYFVERGRANARHLMDAGLYEQLSFIGRWTQSVRGGSVDESSAIASFASKLKLAVSLATSLYNVGRWLVEPDEEHPGRVWIAIREAGDYSEPMRLAAEGFLNECASDRSRVGGADLYRSERPRPDLILFRMNRDIADLAKRRSSEP